MTRKIIAALCAASIVGAGETIAQESGREIMGAPPPVEPSYLFTIPAGRVVRSLDLDVAASGVFLGEGGGKPVGTSAVLGLGDIAEVEIGAMELASSLGQTKRTHSVPAGGLRVYLPGWKYWHGLSASFRRSGTHEERVEEERYEKKVGNFAVMATLANFLTPEEGNEVAGGWQGIKVKTHLGMLYVDPRLTPSPSKAQGFWKPFGGFELWRKDSRARIMGELGWNADFQPGGQVEEIWIATGGVRFFFSKHVTADIGVKHQSNQQGLSESVMQFKLRMSFPTHLLRERIVGH
jgi:hypothetical protein